MFSSKLFFCLFYIFIIMATADKGCLNRKGTCQLVSNSCAGKYRSGFCSGPATRKCCIPNILPLSGDSRCTLQSGTCKSNSSPCSGSYKTKLCSGPSSRQCCVPSSNTQVGQTSNRAYECYGDFSLLTPTGASSKTAAQDRLKVVGVAASQQLVATDYAALRTLKKCCYEAAKASCIHPAIIGALASRESRAGKLLNKNGMGDCDSSGHCAAYGVLQCDIANSGLDCKKVGYKSCAHFTMLIQNLLLDKLRSVVKRHPTWAKERQLQGAVAAYNFGASNVQSWGGLDIGTTNNDYSNDVMARAQHLMNQYGWN